MKESAPIRTLGNTRERRTSDYLLIPKASKSVSSYHADALANTLVSGKATAAMVARPSVHGLSLLWKVQENVLMTRGLKVQCFSDLQPSNPTTTISPGCAPPVSYVDYESYMSASPSRSPSLTSRHCTKEPPCGSLLNDVRWVVLFVRAGFQRCLILRPAEVRGCYMM